MADPGCQEPTATFGVTLPGSGDHPAPDAATNPHTLPPPCHGNHPEHPKHKQLIFSSLQGGLARKGKGWGEDTSPARAGIWGAERPCPPTEGSPPCRAPPLISQGALGSILHHPEWWHPSAAPHLGLGYPMGQLWGRRSRTPLAPATLLPGAESCQALGVLGCSSPLPVPPQ